MTKIKRPVNSHKSYHAHVYFDEKSKMTAKNICREVTEKFGLKVGRLHEKLVGPHPCWSCQIIFDKNDFEQLIPWLEEHRQNLSILIHAVTGDDLKDHTEFVYWLGHPVELNVSMFKNT